MKFSEVAGEPSKPNAVVPLPPAAFKHGWHGRPQGAVRVGVRCVSEAELEQARSAAVALARAQYPHPQDGAHRIASVEGHLLRLLVATATTDPDDVSQPCPLWPEAADEVLPDALTDGGFKAIYDALEAAHLAASPVRAEATPEEIDLLPDVALAALPKMPEADASRVRRLLGYCLDAMQPFM